MNRRLEGAIAVVTALAATWIAFALMAFTYGEAPRLLVRDLFAGTWGTGYGAGQVLFKATPLVCTGVAVELALRAGLFNIGGEGQLAIASLAIAVAGARVGVLPAAFAVPLLVTVAATAGGLWALAPALLRTRFGAHEVITTIMMNRIAECAIGAAMAAGLALPGSVRTASVAASALVPRLDAFCSVLRGSAASLALLPSVALAFVASWALRRTAAGRETVLIGLNESACRAAGVPVARRVSLALVASGGCAGLASVGTVLGYKGYDEMGLGAGAGFGGIAVALLGRGSPFGVVLAALFFGTLAQGGLAINGRIPREAMDVLEAVIIVSLALVDARVRRRVGVG